MFQFLAASDRSHEIHPLTSHTPGAALLPVVTERATHKIPEGFTSGIYSTTNYLFHIGKKMASPNSIFFLVQMRN